MVTMKINDYAKKMEIHPVTVRRWIREGKIRALKTPGGGTRVLLEEKENQVIIRKEDKDE